MGSPSASIIDAAKTIAQMREALSAQKEIVKTMQDELDRKEFNLYQEMENQDVTSVKIDDIGTVYKYAKPWARVSDMQLALAYFKKLGIDQEVFRLEAWAKRLNEYVKENFIEKNLPIPEAEMGVDVTLSQTIGIRRG